MKSVSGQKKQMYISDEKIVGYTTLYAHWDCVVSIHSLKFNAALLEGSGCCLAFVPTIWVLILVFKKMCWSASVVITFSAMAVGGGDARGVGSQEPTSSWALLRANCSIQAATSDLAFCVCFPILDVMDMGICYSNKVSV